LNDHVPKPISPDLLYETMLRWLASDAPSGAPAPRAGSDHDPDRQLFDRLSGIDDLDVQSGLAIVRGRRLAYLHLLRTFMTAEADLPAKLTASWQAGRADETRDLAHALKGAAGSIGASDIQALATEINQALRQGLPDAKQRVDQALPAVTAKLARLIDALQQALATDQATSPAK
jgi:HPt (histidine-containing phosphotransfer) domain-containing protein